MRHLLHTTAALALLALAMWTGYLMGTTGQVGVYDVPMGTITVQGDGTAQYVPSTPYLPGACAVDDTNATTGEPHRPYYACAPLHAPDGALVEWLTADDGSAVYGPHPSAYVFDPEMWGFVLANTPPYVPAP